ncbi:hypothetical protein sos41_05830 [Alphaproteobacteria bacterium SO-S41]|nr:hypothetical protein sos41_05830 [Alphaproteobacteria bacterium SO-S41]
MRLRLAFSAAASAAVLSLLPAAAFDCKAAASPTEKAICADPDLKAADDAMSAAYDAVMARIDAAQKEMLKASQVSWLKMRDESCSPDSAEFRTCLLDTTKVRTTALTGAPQSGPGLGVALTPYFVVRPLSKTACSADVNVYLFGAEGGAGGQQHDAWVKAKLAQFEKEYGARDPDMPAEFGCDYEANGVVTYASPDLISESINYYTYGGGAHGFGDSDGIVIDLKAGKALAFAEVFDAAGAAKLVEACTTDIHAQKIERAGTSDDPAESAAIKAQVESDMTSNAETLAKGVKDLSRWSIYADYAEVNYAPYALGSYAEGPYYCTLPKALLQEAAGAKGWLVP